MLGELKEVTTDEFFRFLEFISLELNQVRLRPRETSSPPRFFIFSLIIHLWKTYSGCITSPAETQLHKKRPVSAHETTAILGDQVAFCCEERDQDRDRERSVDKQRGGQVYPASENTSQQHPKQREVRIQGMEMEALLVPQEPGDPEPD